VNRAPRKRGGRNYSLAGFASIPLTSKGGEDLSTHKELFKNRKEGMGEGRRLEILNALQSFSEEGGKREKRTPKFPSNTKKAGQHPKEGEIENRRVGENWGGGGGGEWGVEAVVGGDGRVGSQLRGVVRRRWGNWG